MTEAEARDRVASHVSRGTLDRLEAFAHLIREHAAGQNLVSAASLETLWSRHILDSSQLVDLAPAAGLWVDIGSGAGLPGLVVASITERPVRLIEPRSRRAAFLDQVISDLRLGGRVAVLRSRAETAEPQSASVISARAVAPLVDLFAMGRRHATADTVWILPKGRSAAAEVALADASWQARMRLVPSVTDSDASIVVASHVSPRSQRS